MLMELFAVQVKAKLTTEFASAIIVIAVKQALKALSAPLHRHLVGLHWWILTIAVFGNVMNTGDVIAVERRKPVFIATA